LNSATKASLGVMGPVLLIAPVALMFSVRWNAPTVVVKSAE